jgi:hypothetical protein
MRTYEDGQEKVWILRNFIEVRVPLKDYRKLSGKHTDEEIITYYEKKEVRSCITGRKLIYLTKESGVPLLGNLAFGIIDRGTNLLQIRPVTGCNLNCIYCSVDEGRKSSKITDYLVDFDYLLQEVKKVAEMKGDGIEAHLDGQGEPLIYPWIIQLLRGLRKIPEIETISIQTNGLPLSENVIRRMEPYVSRINLSMNALDERIARFLAGSRYDVARMKEICRLISESKIDLLLAPVWIPGINDGEIPRLIDFSLSIGAGKRYPPLGIQKFVQHKFGRRMKVKVDSFRRFYEKLEKLERIHGVKLRLSPEDFGIERRRRVKKIFRKGEKLPVKILFPGRMPGEAIGVAKGRNLTILTSGETGKTAKVEIIRAKDGIYLAKD